MEASGVTNTLDGNYNSANGDLPIPYNRVAYSAAGNGKWGINYISAMAEVTFSGSDAYFMRQVCTASGCRDWTSADGVMTEIKGLHSVSGGTVCDVQELVLRIFDVNNNPMPSKSSVSTADADKVAPLTVFPATVGSTSVIGGTIHKLRIKPDAACAPGSFAVSVTTPGGRGSVLYFKSAP